MLQMQCKTAWEAKGQQDNFEEEDKQAWDKIDLDQELESLHQ